MDPTLISTPANPPPGTAAVLSVAASSADVARYVLTAAPQGSALVLGPLVDAHGSPVATFTPDVPGEYDFTVYEYRAHSNPPAYPGDPAAGSRLTYFDTVFGDILAPAVMSLPIRTLTGDDITLEITVLDLPFSLSSPVLGGGISPPSGGPTVINAALVMPASRIAQLAALDFGVLGALTSGGPPWQLSTFAPDIVLGTQALVAAYEAHRINTASHTSPDAVNVAPMLAPWAVSTAVSALAGLRAALLGHEIAGAAGTWHTADDTLNVPATRAPRSLADAVVSYSDLAYRVYWPHRLQTFQPASHIAPDTTDVLALAPPLCGIISAYLDAVVAQYPSVPNAVSGSEINTEHQLGFQDAGPGAGGLNVASVPAFLNPIPQSQLSLSGSESDHAS